jgi:predicted regulator of Ras-like GTPase activity (Roadblock/LC7/MglB family)
VAHCDDLACTSATISAVTGTGSRDKGKYSSIAIGSDGLAIIAYYDATEGELEVAHCSNVKCTSSTTKEVVTSADAGKYTSITIGTDGLPLISYWDADQSDLEVAHCSDVLCSSKTKTTIDTGDTVGQYTSITIGVDGYGLISYYDYTNGNLKTAHCTNTACTNFDVSTISSYGDVGKYTCITVGNDGLAVISYIYDYAEGDQRLRMAHCSNTACTSASTQHVDYTGGANAAKRTAITIGSDGLPFIAYYDQGNSDLKVAHCNNATCSSASVQKLDTGSYAGFYPSVTIGMDGMPIISYYKGGSADNLKVAHCSNVFCIPNWRR